VPGLRQVRRLLRIAPQPLELQLVGRTLLHSVLVGAVAGLVGSLFFYALEVAQGFVLEGFAGYEVLRAAGEELFHGERREYRPWLLALLPALGALVGAVLSTRFAPETPGGGADAIIRCFHQQGGIVRARVPLVKGLAAIFTLGFGGSGGREGPTMLLGGSLGSLVGRYLRVTDRERRILLVAGLAAGVSAVFRTPLGAALLAVEILHRDDFESDALVPSVLASVTAYSVFISFFGEATLFAHAPRYPFVPGHLPLYALMALVVSLSAAFFSWTLHGSQRLFLRLKLPDWARPGLGGLLLGVAVALILTKLGPLLGAEGRGVGILGGGYGAAQLAISGSGFMPAGWGGVELLALLAVLKIGATALTIGSGGNAGDFGPSLVIGGLVGGAFGRAAQLLLEDPRIDPGAFALVGMGTFYGGLAHVPIASLVLVCELAGSYDLLVPLMLAEGIAFVALRRASLYGAQVPTRRDSPAHRDELILDVLREVRVGDVVVRGRPFVSFRPSTSAREVLAGVGGSGEWQDIFPVIDDSEKLVGVVSAEVLRALSSDPILLDITVAVDLMSAPVAVSEDEDTHTALECLMAHGSRELCVTSADGRIVGFLDESEIHAIYHEATRGAG
jgi:chloride channel protein, CIC family